MAFSDDVDHDSIHDIPTEPFVATDTVQPTISITREVLPIAIQHGCELWWDDSAQEKRLDQRGGKNGFTRFVNARIEGKLAEVAFSTFLEESFGVESAVDWRIYGEYTETDDGDLQYLCDNAGNQYPPAVEFDVKKTKPWNQWLLVRDGIFRHFDADVPIVLTKLSIPNDINMDSFESFNTWQQVDRNDAFRQRILEFAEQSFPLEVAIKGAVYTDEFTDSFDQGSRLYDPENGSAIGSSLRCDNAGVHVNNSSVTRYDRILSIIKSHISTTITRK